MQISGIILAGGHSTRMGQDKTLMPIDAETLIMRTVKELSQAVDEIIIASNQKGKYNLPGTLEVPDIYTDMGPLGGIHAGLKAISYKYAFVVAGDLPLFTAQLAKSLRESIDENFEVIVPEANGNYEPLCAVYAQDCLRAIEKYLASGHRSVYGFCERTRLLKINIQGLVKKGQEEEIDLFYNLNTPEDYNNLLKRRKSGL